MRELAVVLCILTMLLVTGCPTTNITTPGCAQTATAAADGGGGGAGSATGEGGAGSPGSSSASATSDCTPGTVTTE